MSKLYIVRLYDGFDNKWMDISEEMSHDKALKFLNKKTNNGTQNTSYDDIDYYKIFPADTVMQNRW